MKERLNIVDIKALEILDSRGNPTVQVEVIVEGGFSGIAMVPSGASTGNFEAVEIRDNDKKRYFGKGVLKAVANVNTTIKEKLRGMNIYEQAKIDETLIKLDGTENKEKLGANATLGVSMAVAKAAANSLGMNLYNYIGGVNAKELPVPFMNIINGGKHAENTLNIQEFMIIPISAKTFKDAIRICVEVYQSLKNVLKLKGYSISVGDEGGFAPNLKNEEEALDIIIEAVKAAGYEPEKDICFALDVAANEMLEEAKKIGKDGYYFWKTKELKTKEEMINYLIELTNNYPIISIEDGLAEDDWEGWKILTEIIGDKIQLVGDDLFVTNSKRLQKGIFNKTANSILIKLNQIGTLTETLETIELANTNKYTAIISHRSGETEDTIIADLAVATNVGQIKTGAPCRTERVSKYNRLLNIEEELGDTAVYLVKIKK